MVKHALIIFAVFSHIDTVSGNIKLKSLPSESKATGRALLTPSISIKFAFLLACKTSQAKMGNNGQLKNEQAKMSFDSFYKGFITMLGDNITFMVMMDKNAWHAGDSHSPWFAGNRPFKFTVENGLVKLDGLMAAMDVDLPVSQVLIVLDAWMHGCMDA